MSTLLVCSVGGHLAELHSLIARMPGLDEDRLWVTFDTPQSRSLLTDEEVLFVSYTGPRDARSIARHTATARKLFDSRHEFDTAISTGSGIALSFLPPARLRGARCHYIESFTRPNGPSATGRLLSCVPGIRLYSQHERWARKRWHYAGSILDAFSPGSPASESAEIRRVVVTLGTMEDYAFRGLIEQSLAVLPATARVTWQVGCTDVSGLAIEAQRTLSAGALAEAIAAADVVIAHAGCGSSLDAMKAGKMPLLVPRRSARGENVDDHQVQLAAELQRRGLAVVREVGALSLNAIEAAARGSVTSLSRAAPFALAR
jgi:UDP-N-acetylglucosamine--N-acetylmuramyl-(pentapeptide) pyrophosphoryl-undecaprenol N-acetylglucosamine transferase